MTWSDNTRFIVATLLIVAYIALCATIAVAQWRKRRQAMRAAATLMPAADEAKPWLVAYASQTGFAEQLAWQTARSLHTAGVPARVAPLSEVRIADLLQAEHALFIVSTYGEGDAPDNASLFTGKLMRAEFVLPHLHYGLLMLGDRQYKHFCGFGRTLEAWLQERGAQALFDSVVLDNADENALHAWQHHLNREAGTSDLTDWQAPSYQQWQLVVRQQLNPGSTGAPTFHIELEAMSDALITWEAGDLVQVLVPGDRQRPREYSIASIPSDGRVHLLIRQERHADGTCGIASGWLTETAALGATIELRLRPHSNFRIDGNTQRPLILIGNGTGLAGLRSHLKARAASSAPQRNWLIFGERNAAHDFYYRDEIEAWQAQGILERADIIFSRDQPERIHVQDRLRSEAKTVRAWLSADAAIYVCGSLEGMAGGVEAALIEIISAEGIEKLIEQGRYRRDVY